MPLGWCCQGSPFQDAPRYDAAMRSLYAIILATALLPAVALGQMSEEIGSSRLKLRPAHEGFTFGLSLGMGDALVGSSRGVGGGGTLGFAGLDALAGGFLMHDLVLAGKIDVFNSS